MRTGRIITLSGGVGGAKLVLGLSHVVAPDRLTVVTNTGDDFEHLGLTICPDTDTVLYTLSGDSDQQKGWGKANETWTFMRTLTSLGGEDWFNLGDGDLAMHVLRTHRLQQGETLSEVIAELAARMDIGAEILPMSNFTVSTHVKTTQGPLPFQHYFVRDRCEPSTTGFVFKGIENAAPNPALVRHLQHGPDAVIIAPSNPFVSVDPIIKLPDMATLLKDSGAPIIAVSPIVGGQAIKGPAAKMMQELGIEASALGVASHYKGLIDGIVIDEQDDKLTGQIEDLGIMVKCAPTIMRDLNARINLAEACLEFAGALHQGKIG